MVGRARFLLAFVLAAIGLAAFGQELVIFTDHRALQVQSHRVEGTWTYLRIGSGEMAVPSQSVLRVDTERGATSAAVLPAQAATPATSQTPPTSAATDMVRHPAPTSPPADVQADDEADSGGDEEMDEPEPAEPPNKPPDVKPPAVPPSPRRLPAPPAPEPRPATEAE